MRKFRSLSCDSLKEIVDKAVHDAHSLGGHPGVRVHLLQHLVNTQYILYGQELSHLVDVDRIRLLPLSLALLLITRGDRLGGFARLGSSFSRCLGRHGRYCMIRGGSDVMKR